MASTLVSAASSGTLSSQLQTAGFPATTAVATAGDANTESAQDFNFQGPILIQ
eukprot:CAMPEP_0175873920 /NCGR_PEP_ID=MMETSP0107_2-20121207/38588_1 /TAXON_ID=195067 ORGANISM="Goniomonas pacifica, Strain CCMP1869" /NCGR_SAMPLE_ID=MMETSP0107_2 /ASSEMBLY_ACC=CAM_ASM_000203 /LENGTH=52 /DNA_ID=CAMNT_0017192723 /DNA_START=356 /DNA_END=514 /DNA_ORIENTATION=-